MRMRQAGLWAVGVLGLGVLGGLVWTLSPKGAIKGKPATAPKPMVVVTASSPLATLAKAVQHGQPDALTYLQTRLKPTPKGKEPAEALSETEAADWAEVLTSLRSTFRTLTPSQKAASLAITRGILDRFAVEPTPTVWLQTLEPSHNLLTLGLADANLEVRIAALTEVGALWSWVPGRALVGFPVERRALADWKAGLHPPVVLCLGHAETRARAAAVHCLAALPLDDQAEPALVGLRDPQVAVRLQVLQDFAARPALLTEDALLPVLHDVYPDLATLAVKLLEGRGLTSEQIGLCKMISHPRPTMRASAIPLVLNRTDIDPVIWLLHLSRDPEESVRLKAVEALTDRITPEALTRLEEMAAVDPSPAVRAAAVRLLPESATTAALPPLPGSPSLNPRAN